jgi:integrase/recombinase XerD
VPRAARLRDLPDDDLLPLEAEEFLSWMAAERGRSSNTLSAYRRDLDGYWAWMRSQGLDLLTVAGTDIESFVSQRRGVAAPASVARQLAAIRMLHRFLAEEGMRTDDPTGDLEGVRVPAGLPKPLSEAEVTSLLDAVVGSDPVSLRDRAMLELLYATGARISEICGLSIGDVDLDHRTARLYGKGSKERLVPVGRVAIDALREWLGESGRHHLAPTRFARRGDAEAVFLNQRGGRMSRQLAWSVVSPGSTRGTCHRTCCAIRAPPTSSTTVPTCAWCRSCSGTRRCRPRRSTRR